MALTFTPRFGLIQWGAGTDPYTRDEANAALATIDTLGAIDVVVVDTAHLPAPGISGRYIWRRNDVGLDGSAALYRDDGTNLIPIWQPALGAPAALSPDTPGAPGNSTAQARGNHGHSMLPWAAAADLFPLAFGAGATSGFHGDKTVRPDHGHAMPTHTKADHDALRIDADTPHGLNSTDFDLAPPAGEVRMFAGGIPPGWLECDGATAARATYPNLFAQIGTSWGNGDGSGTTFSLPDLRGRAPVGAGTGPGLTNRPLADRGGNETHAVTTGELPAHLHAVTDGGHVHGVTDGGHVHAVTDPGHVHGVTDPGHGHTLHDPGHGHGSGGHQHADNHGTDFVVTGFGANGLTATGVTVACDFETLTTNNTDANAGSGTGVTLDGAGTGVGVSNHVAGVSVNNAATGATVDNAATGIATQNTGGGAAMSLMQPYGAVRFAVKA